MNQLSQRKLTIPLSRHSLGTYPETSSHATCQGKVGYSRLAEPLWTDPGVKSGISVHELISTKKNKQAQAGNERSNILPKSSQARIRPPPPVSARSQTAYTIQLCKHPNCVYNTVVQASKLRIQYSCASSQTAYTIQLCKHPNCVYNTVVQATKLRIQYSCASSQTAYTIQLCKQPNCVYCTVVQAAKLHIKYSCASSQTAYKVQLCKQQNGVKSTIVQAAKLRIKYSCASSQTAYRSTVQLRKQPK